MESRLAILTTGGACGHQVLRALEERGVRPHAIVLLPGLSLRHCFKRTGRAARLAEVPRAAWRLMRLLGAQKSQLRLYSARVLRSGPLGSERLLRDLKRLAPDVLVLGGCGVLSQAEIDTARGCVLNGHPALLPWARGNGVVGHSLELGVAVGATCHLVSRQIDAGGIVERRLLAVDGPTTLAHLQEGAGLLAAQIVAEAATRAIEHGAPATLEQAERFPLLRWQNAEHRRSLEELARTSRPRELFEMWKPVCQDQNQKRDHELWRLPATPVVPPARLPITSRPAEHQSTTS